MSRYINRIHINKLFHLNNLDITIEDENTPHLIITGKNGSGKTVLLNAISDFLTNIKDDRNLSFLSLDKWISLSQSQLLNATNMADKAAMKNNLLHFSKEKERLFGKINVSFGDTERIVNGYQDGDFILAFYPAARNVIMAEPKNPTKPYVNKKGGLKESSTSQFLNFLSDLKIQEALARNEKQEQDADDINVWFVEFEKLLREIFQDDKLKLEFNYKDYSFRICIGEKKFKFTQLSDGFSAVLDIVADLILKMQNTSTLIRDYQKSGIVLIDEIETHLHLELQKMVLPILTKVFPNIQFIVTTHSPFVLNSIPNAVAYDLEHRKALSDDLTDYSYEVLAEGYFGVSTESSSVEMRLKKLTELLSQKELTDSDKKTVRQLITELDKISEAVSPDLVGEYRKIKLDHVKIVKEVMA